MCKIWYESIQPLLLYACVKKTHFRNIHVALIMAALWNRAGHYIFAVWFLSFFLSFSSPNLSGRGLDAYYSSTHDVA